jgi:DNA-cytosine methyltransferase
MGLRIASLCSGYSGLDAAMSQVLGGEVAWMSDIGAGPSAVLAHRFPGVPNVGDMARLDWASLPPVDVMGGGIPCQPFSAAGKRKGTADERHLWPYMAAGIAVMRPALVIVENVHGLVGRGLVVILADLAGMGYDAVWTVVAASDAGAPHRRKRLFVLAVRDGLPARDGLPVAVLDGQGWVTPGEGLFGPVPFAGRVPDHGVMTAGRIHRRADPVAGSMARMLLPSPAAHDSENTPENHLRKKPGRRQVTSLQVIADHGLLETGGMLPTPQVADVTGGHKHRSGSRSSERLLPGAAEDLAGEPRGMLPTPTVLDAKDNPPPQSGANTTQWEGVNSIGAMARRGMLGGEILRTPTAQLAVNGGSQHPDKRKAGGHGPTLADEIEHEIPGGGCRQPTPAARDFRSGKSNIMDRNARPLNEVIEHLPTPQAHDAAGPKTPQQITAMRAQGHGVANLNETVRTLPTPQSSDFKGSGATQGRDRDGRPRTPGDADLPEAVEYLPSPSSASAPDDDEGDLEAVAVAIAGRRRKDRAGHGQLILPGTALAPPPRLVPLSLTAEAWGKYAPGVARWEAVLGRLAPPPTQPGRDGKPRLSPLAVEWMMGLPAGWVCDVPGLSRSQMLSLLGNGVVPLQGVLALLLLTEAAGIRRQEAAA